MKSKIKCSELKIWILSYLKWLDAFFYLDECSSEKRFSTCNYVLTWWYSWAIFNFLVTFKVILTILKNVFSCKGEKSQHSRSYNFLTSYNLTFCCCYHSGEEQRITSVCNHASIGRWNLKENVVRNETSQLCHANKLPWASNWLQNVRQNVFHLFWFLITYF